MTGIKLAIPGRPPAKANNYVIVRRGRFPKIVPSAEVAAYEATVAQVTAAEIALHGREPPFFVKGQRLELLVVWHRFMHDGRAKDLDNITKALLDGLTAGGLWHDDSQITILHIRVAFDADAIEDEYCELWVMPTGVGPVPRPRRKGVK